MKTIAELKEIIAFLEELAESNECAGEARHRECLIQLDKYERELNTLVEVDAKQFVHHALAAKGLI